MAFDSWHRPVLAVLAGMTGAGLLAATITVPAAQAGPERSGRSTLAELTVVGSDPDSGDPELVAAPYGRPLARPSEVPSGASDAVVARAHLEDIAPLFGTSAGPASLRVTKSTDAGDAGTVVRFGQQVDGVPVYGGELVVSLDDAGDLISVAGDTAAEDDATFVVTSARAAGIARATALPNLELPVELLSVSTPRKFVYDPTLLGDTGPTRSAWRVVVTGPKSSKKYEVFVDAVNGSVLNAFGATEALSYAICDGGNSFTDDPSYGWCGQLDGDQFSYPSGGDRYRDTNTDGRVNLGDAKQWVNVPYERDATTSSSVDEANLAYAAMADTADLYQSALGSEGFDLSEAIGMTDQRIGVTGTSTPSTRRLNGFVRYCDPPEYFYYYGIDDYATAYDVANRLCSTTYANAYWADSSDWMPGDAGPYPGGQFAIGPGLARSPDVVSHELTHGVTSATNGLIYYKEPGAINESMSDVFGQLAQVYANPGTDTPWLIGDGLAGGPIRSMSNPPAPLPNGGRQPDAMNSSRWDRDVNDEDSGGVHSNSGVGNKAAYLIARGGTFNGVTVKPLDTVNAPHTALSTEKVAKLYWATQQKLPANANYRRLAFTLYDACMSLVGTNGFLASDCTGSVLKAVEATRMNASRPTLTTNYRSLKPGRSAVITVRAGDARGGAAGGVPVKLQRRAAGSSAAWVTIGTTSTSGTRSFTVTPSRSTYYRAVQSAGGIMKGGTSSSLLVSAQPTVSKTVSRRTINYGKTFNVKGKVSPNLSGRTVWLQRYSSGKWRTVKKDKLSSSSRYYLKYKPKSRADRNFRVYLPKATSYSSAVSTKFRITVR